MNIFDIQWDSAPSSSTTTRIGGFPPGFETGFRQWPHYQVDGVEYSLLFLGQLLLPDGRMLELFSNMYTDDEETDYLANYTLEPTGEATVAHFPGEDWPEWVTIKEIAKDEMRLVSASAVAPAVWPDEPVWMTDNHAIPDFANTFLFQIPEHPGGLDILQSTNAYVYWDKRNAAVIFNEMYY